MSGYALTPISVPGAASTAANGINDKRTIVGSYWDASGHEYGFIASNSGYATISIAGAASVSANGINDLGEVVGSYSDSTGTTHGFLDDSGTITTVDVPGALATVADSINDSGQIVGSFVSPTATTDPHAAGPAVNAFLYDAASGFTTLAAGRNDGFLGIEQPIPAGINDGGTIVGTTQLAPAAQPQAWEYVGGTLKPLPTPFGAIGSGATGIDNNGEIVGWYGGGSGGSVPGGAAFLDSNGTLTTITLPGRPGGLNDAGEIVGTANGEGFLATPLSATAAMAGPITRLPRLPVIGPTLPGVLAPCFRADTPIAAEHGPVAAAALRPGDRVRTASGRLAVVHWVGHRTVVLRGHPRAEGVIPVRFTADSFAPGVPRRDVWLSPDHAVQVDGVLIPAHRLVNGATIRRDARAVRVTYVHVELNCHDIILAAGMPTESYLDTGNRGCFDRECGVRPLFGHPAADLQEAALAAYAARGCAPLCLNGPEVAAAHRQLLARAEALGWTRTDDPGLRLTAEGTTLPALVGADGALAFALPAGTRQVRLRSRRFVPAELDAARPDGRRLGAALTLRLGAAPPPAAAFGRGWHAAEDGWRWTDGDARLLVAPAPHVVRLELRCLRFSAVYWTLPAAWSTLVAAAAE